MHGKSLQLCLTLCDPMDGSPPGASVHGTLRARILEGVPRPPPGDLPDAVIEPLSLCSSCTAGRFFTAEPRGKPHARLEWALNPVTGDFIRRDHVITKAQTAGMLPQAKEHLKPPEAGSGKEPPSPRFQTVGLQKCETRNLHHGKPLGVGPLLQEPLNADHALKCLSEH